MIRWVSCFNRNEFNELMVDNHCPSRIVFVAPKILTIGDPMPYKAARFLRNSLVIILTLSGFPTVAFAAEIGEFKS